MKKLFLFITALCCATMVNAAYYSGSCGKHLTWHVNTNDYILHIEGTGPMYNNSDDAFDSWEKIQIDETEWLSDLITRVDISEGATTIGSYVFASMKNLEKVIFPSTLDTIGFHAFSDCKKLANLSLPLNLRYIGGNAFANCTSITYVYLPASVTKIGYYAFNDCTGISYFQVGSDNTAYSSINDALFTKDGKTMIQYPAARTNNSYVIPNGTTNLEGGAFSSCNNLQSITFPASMADIENFAVDDCSGLTSITSLATTPPTATNYSFYQLDFTIPLYVPENTRNAYLAAKGWQNFKNIIARMQCGDNLFAELSENNTKLTLTGSGKMWNFNTTGSAAPWTDVMKTITTVILPDGLTSIGNNAFLYAENLKNIVLPASLTTIGEQAFRGCYKLENITLPEGLTTIGEAAFYYCLSFTTVTIPAGVTSIGSQAFVLCNALTAIDVAAGNTMYCSQDGVLFSKDRKTLYFYPEAKVGSIYEVPENVLVLEHLAISSENLRSITLPASLQVMANYALTSENLQQIECFAVLPPSAYNSTFSNVKTTIPVYVPTGSKAAYQAATGWKLFTNIQEMSEGIEDIRIYGDTAQKVLVDGTIYIALPDGRIYNANGLRVK